MSNSKNFLLAKFGSEEHIKQLKNGEIFFNSIQTYRDDVTAYRGDIMEGKIPINPHKIAIFDETGKNIFETIPYPDMVVESFLGDEQLKMFCAAIIDVGTVNEVQKNEWYFKEEFKNAVQDFGEYVLLLSSSELLNHIENAIDVINQGIGYTAGRILYRDFKNFENTEEYRITGSPFDIYFVKGMTYKAQNEWRVIICDEDESLKANCGNGFLLQTSPFKESVIMKTTDFLNGKIQIK